MSKINTKCIQVGDAGITHSSDSITWGFSTTDNISFNKITVKSCDVEIYDTQNMIHYERSYSINWFTDEPFRKRENMYE